MSRPIEDWELSAYVDGDLPPVRMDEIDAAAATDAALRRHLDELLADHQALRALAEAERKRLGELPSQLERLSTKLAAALNADRKPRERWRPFPQEFGAWRQVAALVTAAAVGWGAASWATTGPDAISSFIDEAAEVHRVAALAPSFSREATSATIETLAQLFSHRLTPPDLSDDGFLLSRVDVAATDTGPAAVFFYTDPEARRLSLVLSLDTPILDALGRDDAAAPRVTTYDGLAVSFGRRNDVAYALVGSVPEPSARHLAARAANALTD